MKNCLVLHYSRRIFSWLSSLYGIFAFIRDECLPDDLSQSLKLRNLLEGDLGTVDISWFWFLLVGVILYIPEIITFVKKLLDKNKEKISLVSRSGKLHEGLWDGVYTWLEITGTVDTKNFVAILTKLDSQNEYGRTDHLSIITKSSSPKLTIVDEKVFVTKPNGVKNRIAIVNGDSKDLPSDIHKFYFEIDLSNGKQTIANFKGYLVERFSRMDIEPLK